MHTRNLNHVEPAHGVLVAAVDGLQRAIWANGRLGWETPHAEQHVQDIGETLGLVIVVRGALVKGPLGRVSN